MSPLDFTAETAIASTVPEPFGKPSGPGLWHVKGMELPAYVQHVAHDLLDGGHAKTRSQAIKMAKGIIAKWAKGIVPGHPKYRVHPDVRAAAVKAVAEWNAKRARAHAQHDHAGGTHVISVDLARTKQPKSMTVGISDASQLQKQYGLDKALGGKSTRLPGMIATHSAEPAIDRSAVKSRLIAHLRTTHRLSGSHEKQSVPHLHATHRADHMAGNVTHTHKRMKNLANSTLVFDAWGQRIDLAKASHKTTHHRHQSSYAESGDVSPSLDGTPYDKHPSKMTPEELCAHLEGKHGIAVTAKGGKPSLQDLQAMRRMHSELHPNQYDLASSTTSTSAGARIVTYKNGTRVVHHASKKKGDGKDSEPDNDPDDKGKKGHYVGFRKLVERLKAKGHSEVEAKAIAASIGRKKYGAAAFQKAAAKGRKMG